MTPTRPRLWRAAWPVALALAACGGGKKAGPADPDLGQSQATAADEAAAAVIDAGPPPDAAPPPSPVTFVLTNAGTEELALNMDRGWGGIIQAYTGKPPKAKPILLFPTYCSASCDAVEEERCPLCPELEKVADIRQAQKLERVAPGMSVEAPWDANALVYEKTRGKRNGKNARCKCWRSEPAAPETYTVKACGLRLSTTTEKSSQLVCAEGQMTLPVTEPIRVELSFADAPPPPPARKR
jgi:hypothetical protein